LPYSALIFETCKEIGTNLKEKICDNFSQFTDTLSSILLRLYDQAISDKNKEVSNKCLDIWDVFFENRIGRVMALAKAIER